MVANPLQVANRAVHHEAAALGRLHDVVEEVVADDRAALSHAEQIDDQHVAGLQHVHRHLVVHPTESGRLRLGVDHAIQVRTHGHELHRERAPDQLLAGMQDLKAVFVLIAEALAGQHRQDFLGRHVARALDQAIRHLRPSVGKPLERVLRCPLDHLFFGQREQLRVRDAAA